MKHTIKLFFAAIALFCSIQAVNAQKLGHINSVELLDLMPEKKSADTQVADLQKKLVDQAQVMQGELQKKYQAYQAEAEKMTDAMRKLKEDELNDLDKRIQEFGQNAEKELSAKREALYKPVLDKAKKGVEDAAKEAGYTWVFDTSAGNTLVFPPSDNILPLVKKKLGIQ